MMGDDKRVKATVILLCYNQEKTVRRAMDSLLRQTCGYTFEILVADDGSTDATRDICSEYSVKYPERVRMLPRVPNKGIVSNYFDAVEAARGEYVADCAGDDEWIDASRMEKQIRALDENPCVMVVSSKVETYDTFTREKRTLSGCMMSEDDTAKKNYFSGESVMKALFNHTDSLPYVLSSALYRKAPVMRILREKPDILRCHDGGVEDVPLIAALAAAGDVLYLPLK
ncbi:MAG: glycosyltransferase, partial [Muribaculaceae bacterium]|nr:glycosyltransferase [Muribaculaceae bacterium]